MFGVIVGTGGGVSDTVAVGTAVSSMEGRPAVVSTTAVPGSGVGAGVGTGVTEGVEVLSTATTRVVAI